MQKQVDALTVTQFLAGLHQVRNGANVSPELRQAFERRWQRDSGAYVKSGSEFARWQPYSRGA